MAHFQLKQRGFVLGFIFAGIGCASVRKVETSAKPLGTKSACSEYTDGARRSGPASPAELQVSLSKPDRPIRNHIQSDDVKHWSKHWKVAPEHVRGAIEKVGNSVAAVQKELTLQGLIDA